MRCEMDSLYICQVKHLCISIRDFTRNKNNIYSIRLVWRAKHIDVFLLIIHSTNEELVRMQRYIIFYYRKVTSARKLANTEADIRLRMI